MQKPVGHAETDSSKKSEATVPETSCARTIIAVSEADVSKQNPSKMTPRHKQTHEKNEVVDISKKPDTLKKPKESNIPENPEETETENSKKSAISVLESLCQNVSFKRLRKHVTTHFSEMNNRHKEIVKALKLNADPAKLVLYSIGKFFLQPSATFRKVTHQTVVRLALVLILECFVMTGSDGIEIANTEKEYAAETAAAWRNRMIKEGGLGHTDEVDARSLLLFISGFGIQDDVFKIQDIVDLIRASNVKGICTALRSSVFLIAKLPEVIDLLVKDNLQIDAVDIVYTFGLEDKCPPQNILRTYLHNLVKDIQNDSSLQTLEAMKQHLCDLKSVRRCLESHNVDPLVLLPDFEINVRIQNLERETNEGRITQKRKFLDNPIHPEANAESMQKPVGHAETDSSKNSEATVPETSCARTVIAVSEADVSKQNASRMTTRHKQTHEKNEVVDISKKPDTLKKPKESNIRENPEETETENSKKSAISVLESLCQKVYFKNLRKHVTTHFSELNSRHKEIVKALKLNANPAKLVLYNIGKFFLQPSATFRKVTRLALVLILECFVMTSIDGIEIANTEKEYAAETAAAWRNRMIKEGGLGHTDEVDARGLLLFISGFGIQDDVFKIQDIVDLIRASNVKGISTALRSSVFLIAKLPEVIDLLVKDNLQIDAVDIAYTFGLEDKCYPRNILRTYLHNLVKDVQNDSSLQTLETRKQQLFNLKSIKQCLESHNVDPSILLPDFKVDEMIEYLARDVNIERTMIPKRKSLENPNHQEAKRSCFNHKDMPRPHKPVVGNHGMSLYNRSTQPSTHYNYSENIHGSVPNGPASGFPGSYDQVVRRADVPPYGWHGPNGQAYDSQPYVRQSMQVPSVPFSYIPPSGGFPARTGPRESFPGYEEVSPSGGFPGRRGLPEPYHGVQNHPPSGGYPRTRGPSANLYSFADKF